MLLVSTFPKTLCKIEELFEAAPTQQWLFQLEPTLIIFSEQLEREQIKVQTNLR